jgi:hypothetical protein
METPIYTGMPHFLAEFDPHKQVYLAIRAGDLAKGFQLVGRPIWDQNSRKMPATTRVNSATHPSIRKDLVALFGIGDALRWKHISEELDEGKRTALRTITYPSHLTRLALVVSTGHIGMEPGPSCGSPTRWTARNTSWKAA